MTAQPQKVQKLLIQPVNLIFRYLQNQERVSIWLHENCSERIEGKIIGFDEYMNIVLDEAEEVYKKGDRNSIGRILLKGDNIALVQYSRVLDVHLPYNNRYLLMLSLSVFLDESGTPQRGGRNYLKTGVYEL